MANVMQIPRINAAQRRINNKAPGTFTQGMPNQRVNAAQRRINNQAGGMAPRRPAPTNPAAPQTGGGSVVQADPNKQIAHLEANINKFGAGKRPNDVKRLEALRAAQTPTTPAPVEPPVELPDDNGAMDPGVVPGSQTNEGINNSEAFFPSARAFERENYESSPMYKFQQAEGEKAINRSLAKRGLLDSGAELESLAKFNTALGATEADKARGEAQQEADRYERMAQNESTRRERGDQRASDDAYRWTQMLLDQNPMKYAADGTDKYASSVGKEANTMANYLQQLFTRRTGGGGGGGGGMGTPAPFPSGPDFSEIDTIGAITGGNANNSWWNGILNSLPGFFDPKTYK